MKCPSCTNVNLNLAERQGVEIDYCPECRGIWLDRGELDKIIERSYGQGIQPPSPTGKSSSHHDHGPFTDYHHDDHDRHHGKHYGKKSWLSELFD